MHSKFSEYCSVYLQDPLAWISPDDDQLQSRYAAIGLLLSPENRLDQVCAGGSPE